MIYRLAKNDYNSIRDVLSHQAAVGNTTALCTLMPDE